MSPRALECKIDATFARGRGEGCLQHALVHGVVARGVGAGVVIEACQVGPGRVEDES